MVLENVYISKSIPSVFFLEKIQKIFEFYINLLYLFSFENKKEMNDKWINNENIILIYKKVNSLLNLRNINIFNINPSESEKYIFSKKKEIINEAIQMGYKYIRIFKAYKINDIIEFEKIKFLEYILYNIKKRKKIK